MKATRMIPVAMLIVASGLALQAASAQQQGVKRTELQRYDLSVPVREVIYLKAELKYVTLRTRAGEHVVEEPLVALEREFADGNAAG